MNNDTIHHFRYDYTQFYPDVIVMRTLLKRYLNSISRRIGFSRLYHIKCMLEPYTKLHGVFMSLFTFYPGVLLYFKRRAEEEIAFPHQPKNLDMTSKEVQQLYHILKQTSSNHAHRS